MKDMEPRLARLQTAKDLCLTVCHDRFIRKVSATLHLQTPAELI